MKMPRQARQKSSTGIYHVILRGINQQQIFEEDEDNIKYLQTLAEYKAISEYKLLAYCLMGNHIHLLIKEEKEELVQIFKRIGGKFVYWYNGKYGRIGHLFQDRFKSEPIETDSYLLTVLRYIHQNPLKAGIVKDISKYEWSSYSDYLNQKSELTDIEFINEMIGKNEFIEFHKAENDDKCIEISDIQFRLTDEQAKKLIEKISQCDNATEFQKLDIKKRDNALKKLKKKGLSIRQISRLTGVSFAIVRKS